MSAALFLVGAEFSTIFQGNEQPATKRGSPCSQSHHFPGPLSLLWAVGKGSPFTRRGSWAPPGHPAEPPPGHPGLLTYCHPAATLAVFLSFVWFWDDLTLAGKRKEAQKEGRRREEKMQRLWAEIGTNLAFGKLTDFKALHAGWSTTHSSLGKPREFFLKPMSTIWFT